MTTYRELTPKGKALAYPYPIALSPVESHFGFYCYRSDGGFCFHNFHAAYAAKDFLERIIDGQDYKWLRDDTILLENGTRIKGERDTDLERAIEYSPTARETEWEPTVPAVSYINSFLGRSRIILDRSGEIEHVTPNEARKRERIAPTATPRKQISDEEKVARKKAKAKDGSYVTISQICEELGHEARVCRGLLRKFKLTKPPHGWAWPPSEAEDIKKRLQKALR
jgi:hypothetical protein